MPAVEQDSTTTSLVESVGSAGGESNADNTPVIEPVPENMQSSNSNVLISETAETTKAWNDLYRATVVLMNQNDKFRHECMEYTSQGVMRSDLIIRDLCETAASLESQIKTIFLNYVKGMLLSLYNFMTSATKKNI